jgi:ATP-dependent protease HslVU (ClpYQ) peptidase subunit
VTCIAGVVHGGQVFIGGDSAGVGPGWDLTVRADEKVFQNGAFLFGFTTSFRMGQLLRYVLTPPIPHEGQDVDRFMVGDFVNAVRTCLKDGGFATKDKEQEGGGTFLIGYRGRLYVIHDDYQVARPVNAYAAAGSGNSFALGSLFSTEGQPPEERVRTALSAAEAHSAGVRGPFLVLSTALSTGNSEPQPNVTPPEDHDQEGKAEAEGPADPEARYQV